MTLVSLQHLQGKKLFGTDGIRGQANRGAMTATVALRVAMAVARVFRRGTHRHSVVIGKDTRLSGYMLEPALTSGFISMGMDVTLLGPMPTPAVAMLTPSLRADVGVMISASHNPYEDNGIKLFGPDGYKLSDEVEAEIEALVFSDALDDDVDGLVESSELGRARRLDDAMGRYIEHAKRCFPQDLRLDGLKVVVDCANGAAYKVAPRVLWELGAEVVAIGVTPDGRNINKDCGATHTDLLCEQVVLHGADIGIALDGDADRLIIVDEKGQVVDGDQVLALVAASWQRDGTLRGEGIVATVMSNLGLERYLHSLGMRLERTAVGDRYVVERMRALDWSLGGEASGHVVMSDHATTGDGLVAALQVLAELVRQDRSAHAVCHPFEKVPQVLKNYRLGAGGGDAASVLLRRDVVRAMEDAEVSLGVSAGGGRLLVRPSGTEPLIRVMAEGEGAEAAVDRVIEALQVYDVAAGRSVA